MSTLFSVWNTIQYKLFPWLEEELDPLTEKEQHFVQVISLIDLRSHMNDYSWNGIGRKRKNRTSLAKAFIAKSVYNLETNEILIEYLKGCKNLRRLCGWERRSEIPSPSTFSRSFADFSNGELAQKLHEAMIKQHYDSKLAGHVSRDSSAIEVREKPKRKKQKASQPKRRRGRPRKDEVIAPKPQKRLDLQLTRNFSENINDLPGQCDVGTKLDSKGYKKSWIGYKLHLDCVDGDIPVSAILTSASVHDSQAAIPLAQMTQERITNLYDVMDSAYDAPQIKSFSRKLGHVPIIDHNPRRGQKIHMDPATKVRLGERSTVERVYSNLKDNFGCDKIRVKGANKVMTHLMFGVIALTATQLFRLLL
jgi:hypothetical protein